MLPHWKYSIIEKCTMKLLRQLSNHTYSHTVLLPKTSFPVRRRSKSDIDVEHEESSTSELYVWQSKQKAECSFVLHDGPPYANGNAHVGHSVNKILKDITNRYKLQSGHRIDFVQGWDCHGLPIEVKALQASRQDFRKLSPLKIRDQARSFAWEAIQNQKSSFQRWGMMADWNNCYYTLDKNYEATQMEIFYKLYEKGYVYQDLKPVYWSPSSSSSVIVKFPMVSETLPTGSLQKVFNIPVYALVWTTTPWTIPANQALCFAKDRSYSIVRCSSSDKEFLMGDHFLIATERVADMEHSLNSKLVHLVKLEGADLAGCTYRHPLCPDSELPFLSGVHVSMERGSGLVHTAPAHGPEDFLIAKEHDLKLVSLVNEDGCYTSEAGESLVGQHVIKQGNITVMNQLKDAGLLAHSEDHVHSYPYDWRTKQPVIFRASKQWFINTDRLKSLALDCLNSVNIHPEQYRQQMESLLMNRPSWCISRQRVWGVPLPVFYCVDTGEPLINRHTVEHIENLIRQHGTDCWWAMTEDQLLPSSIMEKIGIQPDREFKKGADILDIWFESGVSWATVLKDHEYQADLCIEGMDQIRGWFQSSLLTAAALTGKPPYRNLLIHGFTVDENGNKMSKSQGNVIDPQTVIEGGQNKKKQPAYGEDVLRWWVASHATNATSITIGSTLLTTLAEQVHKIRIVLRFLLGALNNYDHRTDGILVQNMPMLDQYMLHLLTKYSQSMNKLYEAYEYNKVARETLHFITSEVSAFYCHLVKDRLYCEKQRSVERRSCQTVLFHMLEICARHLAPILPHLTAEVATHHPCSDKPNLFRSQEFADTMCWENTEVENIMKAALEIRDDFNSNKGEVNPRELDVLLFATEDLYEKLKLLQTEEVTSTMGMCELLQVSHLRLTNLPVSVTPEDAVSVLQGICHVSCKEGSNEERYTLVISATQHYQCGRCRMYTSDEDGQLCQRCSDMLQQQSS
ncbi:PREDICTED: isoleucine--tRNA ligase, mitochondrial-like isoform X2 [Priapulus caudatus]|uniref:isoleucine--tRNA ligase n=1 Tax=Priapulus caudatus TaxID=37621 RepID=A0ABM1EBE1_PRICU|nr:PREDICTED: isoleucine--tRNA ligase, mitochondrial-like isoform X2 [Priapulus caudatus]